MKRVSSWFCCAVLAAATLVGCASRPVQAPVLDRAPTPAPKPAAAPEVQEGIYTVKRGDTMFSIALDHGLDYKELAAWNNVQDPSRIRPGQKLRIKPPPGTEQESLVTVHPVTSSGPVETHPLGAPVASATPSAAAAPAAPGAAAPAATPGATAGTAPVAGAPATEGMIKSGPIARKLPYSPENVALLQNYETRPAAAPATTAPATTPAAPAPSIVPSATAAVAPAAAPAKAPAVKPAAEPAAKAEAAVEDEDKLDWGWPVQGKVIAGFSEPNNKGIDIAAKMGVPVVAAASGRVIYIGQMRAYGKLVVIKHNSYSSVYAHNSQILVKEGQTVVKGQKIAEIGDTDSDRPMLHFEIRKHGKPVDPAKYLPPT